MPLHSFPAALEPTMKGLILTLVQTGKSDPKPIVCLQAEGCDDWNAWYSFVTDQLLKRGLINEEDLSLFRIVNDVESDCG